VIAMPRDQMINFLETTVIFLLLTNAVSGLAAVYAISLAQKGRPAMIVAACRPNGALSVGSSRER
jgi:hypothetical protein